MMIPLYKAVSHLSIKLGYSVSYNLFFIGLVIGIMIVVTSSS